MKTIIIKGDGNLNDLTTFIHKIEKFADKTLKNAVICTRLLSDNNYNTICGEVKDAVAIDDFDLFIIGITEIRADVTSLRNINKSKTLLCDLTEIESVKNYIVSL